MNTHLIAHQSSKLFLLSGPAGSGKTTLCDLATHLLQPRLQRVVTATTRAPRSNEIDGLDYYFFSKPGFEAKIQEAAFYEYAQVHQNHYYGCLKCTISDAFDQKQNLLLSIDVQGSKSFQEAAKTDPCLKGKLVTIFIMPDHISKLKQRLEFRNQNSANEIELRLKTAEIEIAQHTQYDHCIISTDKQSDLQAFLKIYNLYIR